MQALCNTYFMTNPYQKLTFGKTFHKKRAGEARPFWDKGLSGSGLTHELHSHPGQGVGLGQHGGCVFGNTSVLCCSFYELSEFFEGLGADSPTKIIKAVYKDQTAEAVLLSITGTMICFSL